MTVMLLIEHHLGFLCLKGGSTSSSESTLVKMTHCWKSHVAHLFIIVCKTDIGESTKMLTYLDLSIKKEMYIPLDYCEISKNTLYI